MGNSEVRGGVRVWFRGILRVGVNSFCLAVFLITFKRLFILLLIGVVILFSVDFIGDEMLYVTPSSLGACAAAKYLRGFRIGDGERVVRDLWLLFLGHTLDIIANSEGLFSHWDVTGESLFKGETESTLDKSHTDKDSNPVSEFLHGAAAMGVTRVREWEKRGEDAVSQTPHGVSDIGNGSWQPFEVELIVDVAVPCCIELLKQEGVEGVDGEDENRTSFGVRVAGLGEDTVDISETSVEMVAGEVIGADGRVSEGIGTVSDCGSDDVEIAGGNEGKDDVVETVEV